MKKQKAVLLGDGSAPMTHRLTIHLQEKRLVVMEFNDPAIAQSMKDYFSVSLRIGPVGIRDLILEELG